MTNEAAERLRDYLDEIPVEWFDGKSEQQVLDQALAAERRATVERIRAALDHPLTEDRNAMAVIRDALNAEADHD